MTAVPFTHYRRYARMYHRTRRTYGNVVAPAQTTEMVLFAETGGGITATPRRDLRPLRWYERLLDR